MYLTGEMKFDFATYRRMIGAASGRSKVWLRVIGCVVFILGVGSLVTAVLEGDGHNLHSSIADLVFGVVLAGALEVTTAIGWHRIAALRERPWRYDVSESRIGIHTPHTDVSLSWDGVAKVRTHPEFWLLRFSTRQTIPIPRAAFAPDDAASIDSLVARRQAASAS